MKKFLVAALILLACGAVVATGAVFDGGGDQLDPANETGIFLQPADTPNGERYAEIDENDELFVSLDVIRGTQTRIDDVFELGYAGREGSDDPAEVWVEHESDILTLLRMDTGEPIEREEDAVTLEAGESVLMGFIAESDQEVESVLEQVTYRTNVPDIKDEDPDPGLPPTPTPPEPVPTPFFDVTIDDVTSQVTPGDTVTVDATIENTGDATGTQPIVFDELGGVQIDETTLTLDPGESASLTFTWQTPEDAEGSTTLAVSSDDDTDTAIVEFRDVPDPGPFFEVTIDDATSPVTAGEAVDVSATVENTGTETDTQDIVLRDFDGNVVDTISDVTLEPGESTTLEFTWQTTEEDAETGTLEVASDDDSDTITINVLEPGPGPFFEVVIDDATSPVTAGEPLDVTATIENVGSETDTQDIVLRDFDGHVVDTISDVTLSPDERTTLDLVWETDDDSAETGTIEVASDDDIDSVTVTVLEPDPPLFQVDIINATTPVDAGETVLVDAVIENVGGQPDTQTVELRLPDGTVITDTELSLEPGEAVEVQFPWATTDDDVGTTDLEVASEDDANELGRDSTSITIDPVTLLPAGLGAFIGPWWIWLILFATLSVITDYLTQTRVRDELPLFDTPAGTRNARFRHALIRLGLLWVVVFILAFTAAWLLVTAGITDWPLFGIILGGSIVLGLILGSQLLPDIDGGYTENPPESTTAEET